MTKYAPVLAATYLLLTVVLGAIAQALKINGAVAFNIAAIVATSAPAANDSMLVERSAA